MIDDKDALIFDIIENKKKFNEEETQKFIKVSKIIAIE